MEKYFVVYLLYYGILFIIYRLFFYWSAADGRVVEAFSNESDYTVYSGRNVYEWWKSTLTENEKILYDEMKESYLQFSKEFSTQLDELTTDELDKTYRALLLDHPEIFWMDRYNMSRLPIVNIVFTDKKIALGYFYTKEEAMEIKSCIEPMYLNIVNGAKKQEKDSEKIKYVHNELIKNSTYTSNVHSHEYQSIISIFKEKKSVCAGYAYGFKFIMDQLGIESIVVKDGNNEDKKQNHVWNMVKLNEKWYNLDVSNDSQLTKNDTIAYNYFLKENSEFYKDHKMQEGIPQN